MSNYPSNSGPPPPPGSAYHSQLPPGPFSVQAGYATGENYYQPNNYYPSSGVSNQFYQYPIGYAARTNLPPAVATIQSNFSIPPNDTFLLSTPALPYSSYMAEVNNGLYFQQLKLGEKVQQELASTLQPSVSKPQEAPLAVKNLNVDMKENLRQLFINELMRRQEISGTLDFTQGTITEMKQYTASDPVVTFYQEKRQENLLGQAWNPEADCEYLRSAMKGLGTDEEAIIAVVTTRCNTQRQKLKEMYKTMYGRDLIEDIHSELSGDFRETVMGLFVRPAVYDAWSVKQAIYGLGTDENTLIEIFMSRTNKQLREMKEAYPEVVSPSKKVSANILEEDIRGDTSGDFKKLLISAVQSNRYEITRDKLTVAVEEKTVNGQSTGIFEVNYQKLVDGEKVRKDATRLYKAGEDRWGTDEEEFNIIFSTRDHYHLREVWNEYVKIAQRDILNSIDRETSGNFKKGLKAISTNIRCRPMYFAERLRDAMKGLGTDDKTLIRIIITRSEIDLVEIKKCFLQLTQQTLWRWIKDDTSGDYRRILLAIVGKD